MEHLFGPPQHPQLDPSNGSPRVFREPRPEVSTAAADVVVEVVFKSGDQARRAVASSLSADASEGSFAPPQSVDPLQRRLQDFGIAQASKVYSDERIAQDAVRARTAAPAPSSDASWAGTRPSLDCYVQMRFPAGTPQTQLAAALRELPEVAEAAIVPQASPPSAVLAPPQVWEPLIGDGVPQIDPTSGLESQWYLHRLNVPPAWQLADGSGVVLADIDWGYRTSHQDLREGVEYTHNAVDGSGTVTSGPHIDHGTAVLGIAGARENGLGMKGCAPRAGLWAIQADSGTGPSVSKSPWADAIDHVVQRDAGGRRKVNNLEVQTHPANGNYEQIPTVRRAVQDAIEAGCVVCVAAGNGDRRADETDDGEPFEPTGSILVGATTYLPGDNVRAWFSNYGNTVAVCAPGDPAHDVTCATAFDHAYRNTFGGTSGATPKVAGVVALMLSVNPALSHHDVREILVSTGSSQVGGAKPVGAFANAEAAVAEAMRRRRGIASPNAVATLVPVAQDVGETQFKVLTDRVGQMERLLTAQLSLQALQLGSGARLDKAASDELRAAVLARAALDKARAQEPFAELQGLKEALAGLAVPGKEGGIAIQKGGDGQLMLRFKQAMFTALDEVAAEIVNAAPAGGHVIASRTDAAAADRSAVMLEQLNARRKRLAAALAMARMTASAPIGLPAVLATVQAVPVVMNVLSDATKFLRVDRQLGVFDAGDETERVLASLIESRAAAPAAQAAHAAQVRVVRIEEADALTVRTALELADQLEALRVLVTEATVFAARQTNDATDGGSPGPAAGAHAEVQAQLMASKALLESLDPQSSGEAFWTLTTGLVKHRLLSMHGRIELRCIGQSVQMLEKRIWRSDRLTANGEVQVEYRILDPQGRRVASGIRLVSTAGKAWEPSRGVEAAYPQGPSQAATAKARSRGMLVRLLGR